MTNIFKICELQAGLATPIETLIERLVEKKKLLHDLENEIRAIEEGIKIRGEASYVTNDYTAKVTFIQKKVVNWKNIAAEVGFDDALLCQNTKTTSYYSLLINLKK